MRRNTCFLFTKALRIYRPLSVLCGETLVMRLARPVSVSVASIAFAVMLFGMAGCVAAEKKAPGGSTVAAHHSAVPAPSGGDITKTVAPEAAGDVTTAAIGQPAALPSKVTITVISATLTTVKATTPGEIAGPAVVAKVKIENGTASAIDLGSTVVSLLESSDKPGQATTAGGAHPFIETAAAGQTLNATYVFNVSASGTNPITISVSYAGGAPVALFAGNAS